LYLEEPMTKSQFLQRLETILEVDPETLQGSDSLKDLGGWDSLAVMSTLAVLDRQLGVKVPAKTLYECRTVDDIAALAGLN
jgi:acyl carrier protein